MTINRLSWFHDPRHLKTIESGVMKAVKEELKKKVKAAPSARSRSLKWAEKNPHKVREYQGNRRSRLHGNNQNLSTWNREIMRTIYQVSDRVTHCTGIEHHVDHIIPLARGGRHSPDNLQVITAALNYLKSGKTPEQFAQVLESYRINLE